MINDLIVEYYEKHANFVGELDKLDVDPIYKWNIKKRLRERYLVTGDLKPSYGIVKDFFEYHMNNDNSFGFELSLFGIISPAFDNLKERLRNWFDESFAVVHEEISFDRQNPCTRFICLTELGKNREDVYQAIKERGAIISLEFVGWHKEDNTLSRCIIYDSSFIKIGFVDIKCD